MSVVEVSAPRQLQNFGLRLLLLSKRDRQPHCQQVAAHHSTVLSPQRLMMLSISQASTVRTALFFGSAALTLSTLTPAANAFTLNSTTGSWSNPVGGEWVEYRTISRESQIRWGLPGSFNPFDTDRKSGMGFLGTSTTAITAGDVFGLGRLRHYNQPIWGGAPGQVALSLNLDLAGIGVETFNYALNIEETPNSGTCRYDSVAPCADRITWTNAIAAESFQVGNTEYTLELIGFSASVGGNLVNEFISQEGGNSDAYLYAQLTALTPPSLPQHLCQRLNHLRQLLS